MELPPLLSCVLCGLLMGVLVSAGPAPVAPKLLGTPDRSCTRGPGFWCQNITTAKGCGAVRHCIQTVWEHMTLPEDNDDVCTVCKDMVKQARDQLQSNETQEELKEVFEGSCNLIPIKPVAKGCDKLVDEFIPELVETLASQMNPQVVCSVAGLCNNAEVDRLLAEAAAAKLPRVTLAKPGASVAVLKAVAKPEEAKSDCEVCSKTMHKLQRKVKLADGDDLLNKLLEGCGTMGSFSDGCSAIVLTHFAEIREVLQKSLLVPEQSCELMQYCRVGEAEKSLVNVDVVSVGQVGVVPIGDNMTCQFCERMVEHLRDILVANTTESEFQQVMEGLCKQMKSFKDECLSIVTQYYGMLYNFLVNNLNGEELCSFASLCPSPGVAHAPIWPLLPGEMNVEEKLAGTDEFSVENPVVEITVGSDSAKVSVADPTLQQLPIERMIPHVLVNIGSNKEICEFCEYFLHFVQTELANERTVDKVKAVVEGACARLPASINTECKDFVDAYGNAFMAIVVQEVDPSVICPGMGFCPSKDSSQILLIGADEQSNDKPGCPLCLLAVTQLETIVKDNKTEESVKAALESLCKHLPKSLVPECDMFVDTYSKQVVDALVADFSPQEVCVYIQLCSMDKAPEEVVSGDILTNEIPQYEDQKLQKGIKEDAQCVICEFAMARIDSMLKNNASEEEIKHAVHTVCNHLPKSVSPQCNKFVDQWADMVITMLAQELDPKVVCTQLSLCKPSKVHSDRVALSVLQQHTQKNVAECAMCEGFVQALDTYLRDPNVEEEIDQVFEKACQALPAKQYTKCKNFIEVYGPSIQNIITEIPGVTHLICGKIGVCVKATGAVNLLGGRKCTWGPGYWCQSEENARACGPGTLHHCQERVWKGQMPSK